MSVVAMSIHVGCNYWVMQKNKLSMHGKMPEDVAQTSD